MNLMKLGKRQKHNTRVCSHLLLWSQHVGFLIFNLFIYLFILWLAYLTIFYLILLCLVRGYYNHKLTIAEFTEDFPNQLNASQITFSMAPDERLDFFFYYTINVSWTVPDSEFKGHVK